MQQTWFGAGEWYHPGQSVKALTHFGLGVELEEDDVKAGDFIQMNKPAGSASTPKKTLAGYKGKIHSGHSVVFLAWVCSEGEECDGAAGKDKRIGFVHYGSQTSTRGAGVGVGCWRGTPANQCTCKCLSGCKHDREVTAFGRLGASEEEPASAEEGADAGSPPAEF